MNKAIGDYKLKEALLYADSIELTAKKAKDIEMLGFAYGSKVELYRFLNDLESAKHYLLSRINLKDIEYQSGEKLNWYSRLSAFYIWQGKQDSAFYAIERARSFYHDSLSDKDLRFYYNNRSIYHEMVFRLDSAIHYALKRIDVTEPNHYYALSGSCNRLSKLFITVADYEKANIYLDQGLDYIKKSDEPLERTKLEILLRKCNMLVEQGNLEAAETLLNEFIVLSKDKKRIGLQTSAKILLNKVQFQKLEVPSRRFLINDSLIKNKKLSKAALGQFYLVQLEQALNLKDYALARRNIDLIEGILPEFTSLKSREKFYRYSASYYKGVSNFQASIVANEKASVISERLNDIRKLYVLYDMEAKYNTAQKEQQLWAQNLKLESQQLAIEKQKTQMRVYVILVMLFLVAAVATAIIYQQFKKRKQHEILSLKREQQVNTLELLMEGEEKERFRIAKELHDGVNVDLSAIKYKLTSLLEKNNEVINEAVSMIDKSCEQVRAISHNLVPPALKDFSLVEALEDYCGTTNAIHDAQVSFQTIGHTISLSKKAEANIFRIVQELVNNSIKHAEASEIDVQISYQNDAIQLTVEDNGKGFDVEAPKSNGIGLQNVKSRVAYLNARLDVTSDSKGTSFVIDVNTNTLT